MEVFGIRLIGITVENGHKLLLSLGAVAVIYLVRLIALRTLTFVSGRAWNERAVFWARQITSFVASVLAAIVLLSIWFDDPTRLTARLGLLGAGLAFALQRVITAFAGYVWPISRPPAFPSPAPRSRLSGCPGSGWKGIDAASSYDVTFHPD